MSEQATILQESIKKREARHILREESCKQLVRTDEDDWTGDYKSF